MSSLTWIAHSSWIKSTYEDKILARRGPTADKLCNWQKLNEHARLTICHQIFQQTEILLAFLCLQTLYKLTGPISDLTSSGWTHKSLMKTHVWPQSDSAWQWRLSRRFHLTFRYDCWRATSLSGWWDLSQHSPLSGTWAVQDPPGSQSLCACDWVSQSSENPTASNTVKRLKKFNRRQKFSAPSISGR